MSRNVIHHPRSTEPDLGSAFVSRRTGWLLSVAAMLLVSSAPLMQALLPAAGDGSAPPRLAGRSDSGFRFGSGSGFGPSAEDLKAFESMIESRSALRRYVLPYAQRLLTKIGVGNEQVIPGGDGWLFYRPDIEYVTGPPFLDHRRRRTLARRFGAVATHDPVQTLIDFKEQLDDRGIDLVLLPVPVKPQMYPEHLARGVVPPTSIVQNPSYTAFVEALSDAGVDVFDPSQILRGLKAAGQRTYLRTDTHWTPAAMQAVAKAVAAHLLAKGVVTPDALQTAYQLHEKTISARGDTWALLNLAAASPAFAPDEVVIVQVLDAHGEPWRRDVESEVLLLGDSFSNVYSVEAMCFGTSAGLAEHLSAALGRPIDRITRNAGGAVAGRRALARDLASHYERFDAAGAAPGRERLADKRVVVYQFAMRELTSGDWVPVDLTPPRADALGTVADSAAPAAAGTTVTGRVAERSRLPAPATSPYPDGVVCLRLENVRTLDGPPVATEIIVFAMGMRGRKVTEVARLAVGEPVRLQLTDWSVVESVYGGLYRAELDEFHPGLRTYWGDLSP